MKVKIRNKKMTDRIDNELCYKFVHSINLMTEYFLFKSIKNDSKASVYKSLFEDSFQELNNAQKNLSIKIFDILQEFLDKNN
jgi:hypothetical protein